MCGWRSSSTPTSRETVSSDSPRSSRRTTSRFRLALHRCPDAKAPAPTAAPSAPTPLPALASTQPYPPPPLTSDSPLIRVQENRGRNSCPPRQESESLCAITKKRNCAVFLTPVHQPFSLRALQDARQLHVSAESVRHLHLPRRPAFRAKQFGTTYQCRSGLVGTLTLSDRAPHHQEPEGPSAVRAGALSLDRSAGGVYGVMRSRSFCGVQYGELCWDHTLNYSTKMAPPQNLWVSSSLMNSKAF